MSRDSNESKKLARSTDRLSEARVYQGTLQVLESREEILVTRFIVRPREIAFDISVTSVESGGVWQFSGKAEFAQSGTYVSDNIEGKAVLDRHTIDNSIPTRFVFEVPKESTRQAQVRGWWIAGGERYEFSGALKPLKLTGSVLRSKFGRK
jgi:hypothetical protein